MDVAGFLRFVTLIILCLPFQVENVTISLELISVMKSSMTIQDVAFILNENTPKKGTYNLR